jgi:hypothetical protein
VTCVALADAAGARGVEGGEGGDGGGVRGESEITGTGSNHESSTAKNLHQVKSTNSHVCVCVRACIVESVKTSMGMKSTRLLKMTSLHGILISPFHQEIQLNKTSLSLCISRLSRQSTEAAALMPAGPDPSNSPHLPSQQG